MRRFFCFFCLLTLSSCINSIEDDVLSSPPAPSSAQEETATITLSFGNSSRNASSPSRKTILPSVQALTDLRLTGTPENGTEVLLASADSASEMCENPVQLQTGNWTFTMSGKIGSVVFKDTHADVKKTMRNLRSQNFLMSPRLSLHSGTV